MTWIIRGGGPRGADARREQTVKQLSHIGLDVHKDTIAVAVLRPGMVDVDERTIPNTPEAIRRLPASSGRSGTEPH